MKVIAVTGGLGFIGSYVVEQLLEAGHYVYLIDNETYAANVSLLDTTRWRRALARGRLKYVKADIVELAHLPTVDVLVNLAAESHVDNSIQDSTVFVRTNVLGVQHLLELIRAKRLYEMPRFFQVSTDEVYGDFPEGEANESAPLCPSSPYAASKAAADLLVLAYARTYGITYSIVRPSNCYGLRQHPEKLIPKAVRCLVFDKKLPLHAGGTPRRSWLWVEDCARAIRMILEDGKVDTIYNIGGNTDASVSDIASVVGCHTDTRFERPGVDRRYHVNDAQLLTLGWRPQGDLWRDLPALIEAERLTFRW